MSTQPNIFLFDPVEAITFGQRDTIVVMPTEEGFQLPACATTVESALSLYVSPHRNGQVQAYSTTCKDSISTLLDFSGIKTRGQIYTIADTKGSLLNISQLRTECRDLLEHFIVKMKGCSFNDVPVLTDQDEGPGLDVQARRLIAASNLGFRVHFGKLRSRPEPCLLVSIQNKGLPEGLAKQIPCLVGDTSHTPVTSPAAALDYIDKKLQKAHMPTLIQLYNTTSAIHY